MQSRNEKGDLDYRIRTQRQERAAERAAEILEVCDTSRPPVDPLAVAATESPLLKVRGDDYGDLFDGQLEFHRLQRCFLLFYNTKYDGTGGHHPRTRFSIAHELGHYYLDAHHAYLRGGGESHASKGEFISDATIEQEADAFAASLLMPKALIAPLVNSGELSIPRLDQLAATFQTSLLSTAIRSVRLSHFPCALVAIRGGQRAWSFQADCLIEDARCYPGPKGRLTSDNARDRWSRFKGGGIQRGEAEGFARDWFRVYENEALGAVRVTEAYIPIPVMDTLLVLLTMDEGDLFDDPD